MAIKTNLNIAPYFDDYDISKKYYRVLFKPGRAVQARELTQLQTTLQNQIEQFGENIYKEGSIIKGCTFTEIRNLKYVKVVDAIRPEDFIETTVVLDDGSVEENYFEIEDSLGLKALIVQGVSGFQSRAPDLNTFFIVYLNTIVGTNGLEKKTYTAEETLSIRKYTLLTDEFGVTAAAPMDKGIVATTSVSAISTPIGDSFGLNASEGVIFQRGHFLFVDDQTIVVKKYLGDETVPFELEPNLISVGYTVDESIVNSQLDTSILDNANGSPNENAPGADRLLMVPRLTARLTNDAEKDAEFFILRRYENGNAVETRDVSQFNSIGREFAKRTHETNGDFSKKQFKFEIAKRDGGDVFIEMSEGVMYAKGYRVSNDTKRFFRVPNVTTTRTITGQPVNFNYGGFVRITNIIGNPSLRTFQNISLLDVNLVPIGSAIVKNITGDRLYLFAIRMIQGQNFIQVQSVGSTGGERIEIVPKLINSSESRLIFDFNRPFAKDITNIRIPIRKSVATSTDGAGGIVIVPAEGEFFDENSRKDLLVISNVTPFERIPVTSSELLSNGSLFVLTGSASRLVNLYYNATQSNVVPKVKQADDVFVLTTYVHGNDTRIYTLGMPDAIKIIEIKDSALKDVTSSFKLVNNQKDDFYDHSYIEYITGTTVPANGRLTIRVRVFRTNFSVGATAFTIDSYPNTDLAEIPYFSASDGKVFDVKSSIDFRPYRLPIASYSTTEAGATLLITTAVSLPDSGTEIFSSGVNYLIPAIDTSGSIDLEYYSSRVDYIVGSSYGRFRYVTGEESGAAKGKIDLNDNSIIAEVAIPGYPILTNDEAFRLNRLNESISITSKTVTGYTMKDIDNMSKRIDKLVYYVTLSALEASTTNLLIQDENGNNRFKNGIIADPFRDLSIADVSDATFNASLDSSETALKPSVRQFPLDLRIKASDGTTAFGPCTTLSSNRIIKFLKQQYATSFRTCTSNAYNFRGTGTLTPNYEVAYDTVTNPLQIDIDLSKPFIDFTEALSEVIPLTQLNRSQLLGQWSESNTGTVVSNTRIRSTTTTDTFTQFNDVFRTLSASTGGVQEEAIGDFITDLQFRPFMRTREIQIEMYGLRPNTRHYFFFDGVDVNQHVSNGIFRRDLIGQTSTATRAVRRGNFGEVVKTNANGELFAVFRLPANTFLVGERELIIADVDSFNSIQSAAASTGKLKYNAYNFNIEKAGLTVATRFPDFDVTESTTPRTVVGRTVQVIDTEIPQAPRPPVDPLAQTFFIKGSMTQEADALYLSMVDLYFKRKSLTSGVTIQIREVENGYPSAEILAFGSKHLRSSEVLTSDDANLATSIVFDAPIRLEAEKEYAIIVKPDADDPDYLIFTTKPGGTDLSTGESVNADWGDGVLFTSTNNRAWTAYQDEDIKFNLYRYNFNVNSGTVELETMGHEFFRISPVSAVIKSGELVYALKGSGSVSTVLNTASNVVTGSGLSIFSVGDYIYVANSAQQKDLLKVTSVVSDTSLVIERPPAFGGTIQARTAVAGTATYFNPRKPDFLVLENSSARLTRRFEDGDTIIGLNSGATCSLVEVQNIELSYIQAMINRVSDSDSNIKVAVKAIDPLAPNSPAYIQEFEFSSNKTFNEKGCIVFSKSNDVNQEKNLRIIISLDKIDNQSTTPVIDVETAQLFAYMYQITNDPATSTKYISKKVELQEGFDAEDFRLYVTGYRPVGTNIRAYMKIKNGSDPVTLKNNPWIELELTKGASLFSNTSNTSDYKEFLYEIPDSAKLLDIDTVTYTNDTGTYVGYRSFAIRIDLLSDNIANVPKILDYRGVAFE